MMSGTRKPLRTPPGAIVNALSVTSAVAGIKKPLVARSIVFPLRVAGSSAEMLPEKPLPNWAV